MDTHQLTRICHEALHAARAALSALGDQGVSEIQAAHVTDISTQGDMTVSDTLIRFFAAQQLPAVLYSEESGRTEIGTDPRYTIAFDDIDGTDNYHRGRGLLPYCTIVTLFDSPQPTFADALIAGVIEHNTGRLWHAVRNGGCFLDGAPVKTSGRKNLDRRAVVIVDHYSSSDAIARFQDIYPNAWVKDYGTSALHLAGVASGLFDAYLASAQKAHELGAGYLLAKEAGGVLTDWNGHILDSTPYDFDARYPAIVAASGELGEALLAKLLTPPPHGAPNE